MNSSLWESVRSEESRDSTPDDVVTFAQLLERMADQNRQIKLAAAKKKLKEFQQKTVPTPPSAGPKKKRRIKIESFLQVLASDVSQSNGFSQDASDELKMEAEEAGADPELLSNASAVNPEHVADSQVITPPSHRDLLRFHSALLKENSHQTFLLSIVSLSLCLSGSSLNSSCVSASVPQQRGAAEENGVEHPPVESRPLSSTESLRQLSQQLNGLLSEVRSCSSLIRPDLQRNDTSSGAYINGDGEPPALSGKELESRNQELAAALDSSALSNAQLSSELEVLVRACRSRLSSCFVSCESEKRLRVSAADEAVPRSVGAAAEGDPLITELFLILPLFLREISITVASLFSDLQERKEFEQKFTKEQGAMREQLQVHIQTIGILVSEKSELQTALSYTQQAARQKTAEAEDLSSRLAASKQRVSELERTLSSVSTQQKQLEKLCELSERGEQELIRTGRDLLEAHEKLEYSRVEGGLLCWVHQAAASPDDAGLVCCSSVSEEWRQQSSELSEQLKRSVEENTALNQEREELRRRLEMADVMLQQFSSESGPPSEKQQLQLLLEEKHQLEARATQLVESLAQLRAERDQYAAQIQEDGRVWKERTEQLLVQGIKAVGEPRTARVFGSFCLRLLIGPCWDGVRSMSEERESASAQIQELQEKISELESTAGEETSAKHIEDQSYTSFIHNETDLCLPSTAQTSREHELRAASPSSEPSERERALEQSLELLSQERDALSLQYQAQVGDNEQLSRLVEEQERRLQDLEAQIEAAADEAQNRLRILEETQSDKATISRALTQNRELKDQLEELQSGFVRLTNENMELTSALQSEQHVKKEIARKIGTLQEDLHSSRDQLQERSGELAAVQDQRDQCVAHLQQYTAGYQQLLEERERLHAYILQQTERMQLEEEQSRAQLEQSYTQLQEAQELKVEVQELLSGSTLDSSHRDQGDGLESHSTPENFQKPALIVPEDFQSREEMEEFIRSSLSHLEAERDEMSRRFEEERRLHQTLRQQVAGINHEHQTHGADAGVPLEVHEALRAAMEKLQERFTRLMQEKADLRERLEELEHRCIQLSGETDTIGEYIALYQNQRAVMKQKQMEKEQYISLLARDKEEMKGKLSELQDLVLRLLGERNEWYSRYIRAVRSSAGEELLHPREESRGTEETTGHNERLHMLTSNLERKGRSQCINDVTPLVQVFARKLMGGELEFCNQSSSSNQQNEAVEVYLPMDPGQKAVAPSSDPHPSASAPEHPGGAEGVSAGPGEDGTARQIMQLLQEIQNPQVRPLATGENPCIPFFYRPDEHEEVKILLV
ncbi:hypothetical protein DNTS_003264 [Danionella cerebrum]|uniref:Golgin subfamily A conserved domain-containing protein n=1 Tax=Danionella cerebrum TaxID=2873325 RepID=A0A553MVF5_9TELE|nr:hypothetical protein DNTS_003264 [Danionella translucida]